MPILDSLARYNDLGLLAARCLLALVFAASAYDKFRVPPREIAMLSSLHLPFPRLIERGIGAFEAVGVASLVLGVYARPMSLLLGAFMLVVTVLFVRFWSEQGEKQSADRNVFFSNLSIVGGCLLMAISGPGRMAFAA
jgi:putative oxidoreductase